MMYFGGWMMIVWVVVLILIVWGIIALAITVAYVYSSAVVFGVSGAVFFWELATLIDVMLLGHWLEMRSIMAASSALEELARLMPSEAHRVMADGSTPKLSGGPTARPVKAAIAAHRRFSRSAPDPGRENGRQKPDYPPRRHLTGLAASFEPPVGG